MTHWPDIPYARWAPTGKSLHMWAQIVGKFRLAQTPWLNHSWHAVFYVNARGFTTSLIQAQAASYEAAFDFHRHELVLYASDGQTEQLKLSSMSVAEFYDRFLNALKKIGAPTSIDKSPNEVEGAVPFTEQTGPGVYEPEAARNYWRALVAIDGVFKKFRTGFIGKSSPVHLFWGSLDLAVTRFSGRTAPLHPGGIPALPDTVTREAYSHEVSSAGFWPGGGGIDYPAFYAYAYPMPDGFNQRDAGHKDAYFDEKLGEFVLPYDSVRNAPDPETSLLKFLQATYAAAADCGGWDRATLETALGEPRRPRLIS